MKAKKHILILLPVLLTLSLSAQLTYDEDITLIRDARIEKYLEKYNNAYQPPILSTSVYRVTLLSTYQRDEAYGVRGSFRSKFPGYQTFLEHNGIKYILTAGNFTAKADADDFVQQIRPYFPASFVSPTPVQVPDE